MKRLVLDSVSIAHKEIRQLSRDPISLALTIMFPILLIGIFVVIASAFGAPSYNIPVAVADLDGSPVSTILLDKLTTSSVVRVTQILQNEEQALHAVQSGKVIGSVVIPKGFGNSLLRVGEGFVVVDTDNSKIMAPTLIMYAMEKYIQELKEVVGVQFGVRSIPVEVITRPITGRPPTGDFILPGMLGMITILGAFDDAVNAITRERERGTFPRLILTPINILSIYSGKMIATIAINAIRTTLVLIIFLYTGLEIRGNILLIYLVTSLIAIFTLSVGLTVSSRIRSSSTLTILEIALTFPLFQLTGAFGSPELLASGGRALARALPWTYGNEALRRVIYLGRGLEAISGDLLVLSLSSLILLPIATILSKRTM